MFQAYRSILGTPGALTFSAAGAIGRLPTAMTGLGIILLIQQRTGSYSAAGIVAAVYLLTAAVCGPLQGKIADRYGQRRVLIAASAIYALGIALLLLFSDESLLASSASVVIAGIGAPQTGNMVRTRWTHALADRVRLSTAFAFEAVVDEMVFILGPVAVTFLTLNVQQELGLAAAVGCALVGGWGLAFQNATMPPVRRVQRSSRAVMPWHFLVPVFVAALCIGVVFGSAEVLIVAFTDERGQQQLAGWILAIASAGSLLAGLAVGARPAGDPVARLQWGTALLTVTFVPLMFIDSIAVLSVAVFIVGLTIAPTLIASMSIVETFAPQPRLTEALTWVTTGLASGVAVGAMGAGHIVDIGSASWGMLVPIAAGMLATLAARFATAGPGN